MLIYIILAALIGVFALYPYSHHNSHQSKKFFLIMSFTAMALILGLRAPTVGEDTSMYLKVFKKAQDVSWRDIWSNFLGRTTYQVFSYGYEDTIESSFLGLCKLIGCVTSDPQVYLVIISSLICFLFAKFIYDNTEYVVFATWIFLCDAMFMFAFNGIRQLLSIAVGLQTYRLLKNSKYVKAVIVFLLAFSLHNSSIVCLLLIPIILLGRKKRVRLFKYILIGAIAFPFIIKASAGLIIQFFPRYANYFTTNYWTNSIGGGAILWGIELVLLIYMYFKRFPSPDSFDLSAFIALYLFMEVMGLSITMFSRASYFYRAFLLLFMPDAVSMIKKGDRKIVKITLIVLLFLMYLSCAKAPARQYVFSFLQ